MDIRENIKFILEKRNMTQADLADALGVSRPNIGYYLRGNITIGNLQKIAEALNTTVEAIVSATPLSVKDGAIPERGKVTTAKLVCPHCGAEITLIAK